MTQKISKKIIEQISRDKIVRKKLTRESHLWFFLVFLNHYIKNGFASFHYEMFDLSERIENKLIIIMAFRGSGKSTIMNLSYALWSILGVAQKKFVIIVSNTQAQAKAHFNNIKRELENNTLLRSDLGPFKSEEGEWGQYTLELPSLGAKIICASKNDALRGLLYGTNRPDLIICDDLEDSTSAENKEKRDILFNWFMTEIMTVGSKDTNIVVLGNLLHQDSLLMKLKRNIESNTKGKIFRAYPLLDDYCKILWPQKFSKKDIYALRKSLPINTWASEYILKILPKSISILENQETADKLIDQLGILPTWTLKDAVIGFRAGVLDKKWLETCKDCQNRAFQKPLIQEMEMYHISSPSIVQNQYSSIASCCILYDMSNIGIYESFYKFFW